MKPLSSNFALLEEVLCVVLLEGFDGVAAVSRSILRSRYHMMSTPHTRYLQQHGGYVKIVVLTVQNSKQLQSHAIQVSFIQIERETKKVAKRGRDE
jgi:type IV pilus biogenesis protein CpaD/CtpE